jgi:hypothetical protein
LLKFVFIIDVAHFQPVPFFPFPSSLKNIKDQAVKEKKILGLGATRGGQGFAPLPYVGREIRSIVRDEGKGYYGLIKG